MTPRSGRSRTTAWTPTAIHFHLFNVQVINRVGWDGAIRPPDANEMGWKDTVRMNPLEDIIVALRPSRQKLPLGSSQQRPAAGRDAAAGHEHARPVHQRRPDQPTGRRCTNDLTNFGWEYVWHCHLLGHEENDMMRAMSMAVPPNAPGPLTGQIPTTGSRRVILRWTDNSANESGFTVQRSTGTNAGPWTTVATLPPAAGKGATVTYTDSTVAKGATYYYRVVANNLVGYTKAYAAPAAGYPYVSADSLSNITGPFTF